MEGLPRRPSLGVSILAVGVITPTLCLSQAGKRGLWWIILMKCSVLLSTDLTGNLGHYPPK